MKTILPLIFLTCLMLGQSQPAISSTLASSASPAGENVLKAPDFSKVKKPGFFQKIKTVRRLQKALRTARKEDPDGPPSIMSKLSIAFPIAGFLASLAIGIAGLEPLALLGFLLVLTGVVLTIITLSSEPNAKSRAAAKVGLILEIVYGGLIVLGALALFAAILLSL
jgi:uncharacterized membrane protein